MNTPTPDMSARNGEAKAPALLQSAACTGTRSAHSPGNSERTLRILMLIPQLGYGGAERSFLNLKRLLEPHHEVCVVAFAPPDNPELRETHSTPEYFFLRSEHGVPLFGKWVRWTRRIAELKRLKRRMRVDVAISFLEGANALNVLTRGTEAVIVSVRGSKMFDPHIRGVKGFIRRRLVWPLTYPYADAVVSVSGGISAEMLRMGLAGKKGIAATIGLALSTEELVRAAAQPVEEEIEELAAFPLIASWGRMSDEKGYDHLVRVFSRVKQAVPNAKLLLIGDGPYLADVAAAAQGFGLTVARSGAEIGKAAVILPGYRPHPIRYARLCRVFVLPSLTEGFPNALVEAMAAGAVTFASDGPWGARCVLAADPGNFEDPFPTKTPARREFGVLMPRIDLLENEHHWAEALVNALRRPQEYAHYREAGRLRAMEFDERNVTPLWLDLIRKVRARVDETR